MTASAFDIYMIGVGGQGIGLLSEALLRAVGAAGLEARGVDTHGLAQRGGTVVSHLRIGPNAWSPLVREHRADLVIALERHEALRGLQTYLRPGGTLVAYDAVWQPLPIRLGKAQTPTWDQVEAEGRRWQARVVRVFTDDLPDPRMQNVAVLAALIRHKLLPDVTAAHLEEALGDLLSGGKLTANLGLLHRLLA